jgi:hypothetical protein
MCVRVQSVCTDSAVRDILGAAIIDEVKLHIAAPAYQLPLSLCIRVCVILVLSDYTRNICLD